MHRWDIRYHNFLDYISGGHNTFWVPAANAHSLNIHPSKKNASPPKKAIQPILGLAPAKPCE